MAYDHEKQIALNSKHSSKPRLGDYWHDMFSPVCVVVDVSRFSITTCETTKQVGDNHWTWDLTKPFKVQSRKEFSDRLHYQSEGMKDKTWADVYPKGHKFVLDHIEASA